MAGFLPTGMLDWPGNVATTVFLTGCTLRCPYCHNPSLIEAHGTPGVWEDLLAHLTVRRGWIDGVVVSGGEPTADPDLVALLESLVARGLRVKLDTNGTRPDVLERLLASGLVEYVALDVKTLPHRYGTLGAPGAGELVLESVSLLRRAAIPHEYRVTVYPPVISCEELPDLARLLAGGPLLAIQRFRPGRTLDHRAGDVDPVSPDDLASAARTCSTFLPTVTRGA